MFNPGATTSGGGFPNLDNPQAGQVFGNRLGNVGVDFGPFGAHRRRQAVGRSQRHHLVRSTDQFVVFGSQASATYTAGTDGGFLGNGRADQALTIAPRSSKCCGSAASCSSRTADNSEAIDGAGVSAQLTLLPGVRIGAAYTKTLLRRRAPAPFVGSTAMRSSPRSAPASTGRCSRPPSCTPSRTTATSRALSTGRHRTSHCLRRRRRRSSAAVQRPAILRLRRVQLLPAGLGRSASRSRFQQEIWHRRRDGRDHPQHVRLCGSAHLRRQRRPAGRGRLQRARHRRALRVQLKGFHRR